MKKKKGVPATNLYLPQCSRCIDRMEGFDTLLGEGVTEGTLHQTAAIAPGGRVARRGTTFRYFSF